MGRCRLYAWGVYQGHYKWDNAKFADNVATGAVIDASFGTAGAIASGGVKFYSQPDKCRSKHMESK